MFLLWPHHSWNATSKDHLRRVQTKNRLVGISQIVAPVFPSSKIMAPLTAAMSQPSPHLFSNEHRRDAAATTRCRRLRICLPLVGSTPKQRTLSTTYR